MWITPPAIGALVNAKNTYEENELEHKKEHFQNLVESFGVGVICFFPYLLWPIMIPLVPIGFLILLPFIFGPE